MQAVLAVTVMLVNLSVAIMHVTVSVAIIQLEVSAALMQVTVSYDISSNMWVTIFIVFMEMGVTVAISYVGGTFCSAQLFLLQNAGNCFCYNYVGDTFM